MKKLSFAEVEIFEKGIIKITPHEGVEISAEDIHETQRLIRSVPDARLLIDRLNSYSYSFEAIQAIRNYEGVRAAAIITYGYSSQVTAQFVRGDGGDSPYPMEIFTNKDDAIRWLLLQ